MTTEETTTPTNHHELPDLEVYPEPEACYLTVTFPDTPNGKLLHDAVTMALEDEEFMGADDKVSKAAEGLVPKGTLTATFKRLKKNAKSDYLNKLDDRAPGYTTENRDEKIRKYIYDRFKDYMDDNKTSKRAMRLWEREYPSEPVESASGAQPEE